MTAIDGTSIFLLDNEDLVNDLQISSSMIRKKILNCNIKKALMKLPKPKLFNLVLLLYLPNFGFQKLVLMLFLNIFLNIISLQLFSYFLTQFH